MTIIQQILNKSENAQRMDQIAFNQYSKGEITLEECLKQFYINNRVANQDKLITLPMFKEWLESIGYGISDI